MATPEKQLCIPEDICSFEEFCDLTIKNIYHLFDMNTGQEILSLDSFIHNSDHGLEHEYNVYTKAVEIAEHYQQATGKEIRMHLLYPMAICHDAMRSITYLDTDAHKRRKERRNDRNHERYGAKLFEKIYQEAQKMGLERSLTQSEKDDVIEYLINHDYFSKQLNGARYHEPQSIEGQIVRLADRISVSLYDEINRYRDTGKRRKTPLYNPNVPMEHRLSPSFDQMGLYDKNGWIDEILFFTALLTITKDDFSDPVLGDIYDQRSQQKTQATECILQIARQEGASEQDLYDINDILGLLSNKFGFEFGSK